MENAFYNFRFPSVVNAEATEEIINNKNNGFMGCDDSSNHPTCGQMYYKGVKIPYSQGFCCSCETESPLQHDWNDTASLRGPQFHHKRYRDDTKSIGNVFEGLHSHKTYSTSLLDPLKATKYSEVNKIPRKEPHVQWNTLNSERNGNLERKSDNFIDKPLKNSPNYSVLNDSSIHSFSDIKRIILRELENFSSGNKEKPSHGDKRKKWKKKHLNKLRELLMKSRIKNNEKYVHNSECTTDSNYLESIHTSPVMNFLHRNISRTEILQYTPQNQWKEMNSRDVKVEKTTAQPTLNWKMPIEESNSFISGNKDLRYLENELRALSGITKQKETTIKEVTYKPRIIVDRFQIKKRGVKNNGHFMKRKLHNYIDGNEKPINTMKLIERQLPDYKNQNYLRPENTFSSKKIKFSSSEQFPARDYVISLTGKVHIDEDGNDSPISITFDTPPGLSNQKNYFSNPVKLNRRSVEKFSNPQEIILRSQREKIPNKIIRSESSRISKILPKNLISNEMPQIDLNDIEIVTTKSGKIKPYPPSENKAPFSIELSPISTKSPENVPQPSGENPINLKIIGLISMSNPSANKIEVNSPKKVDKGCLGDLEIVPLIHVKVEKQSSVTPPQEINVKTTTKPTCPFGTERTVQSTHLFSTSNMNTEPPDDSLETVTFFVDSSDEDPTEINNIPREKIELKKYPLKEYFFKPEIINQTQILSDQNYLKETTIDEPKDYSNDNNDIQLNKMLAVMEFIKKLKRILNGESKSNEEPDTIIRLQKFVITPENTSNIDGNSQNTSNYEYPVNISEHSTNTNSAYNSNNFNEVNESQDSPKQTYISELIKEPKNLEKQTLEETLRRKLIDRYLDKDKDSSESQVSEISRDRSSLNSVNAFENTHEVRRSREIGNSGPRLRRKESKKKKKKKKKKKRKKKRKKMKGKKVENQQGAKNNKKLWPFRRQLMSLKMNDFHGNIYDDVAENGEKYFKMNERERIERKRDNIEKLEDEKMIKKRWINSSGFQIRGGQNCMDRRHPPNVNPAKYLESAHCLRFSDLWYSVYKLEEPVIDHTVYVQFFKRERGNSNWRDLTRGEMIRLGTFTRHQRDEIPTIVFTYTEKNLKKPEFSLNSNSQRLLIPLTESTRKQHSEEKSEGINEFLIIPSSEITSEGRECNKAGVGFSAFVMQKDRCTHKRGSCLRNQPLSYWRHDMDARQSGLPGCYFLSNFATVPVNPIKYNVTDVTGREMYLGLVQNTYHVSTLGIEVRADDNNVISTGLSARITEVHIDATAVEKINLSIRLTNTGLVSSNYQARIVECPSGLPNSWAHAITSKHLVPPQHDTILTFHWIGKIVADNFECKVEVINYRGELVAARRIIVQKMNRCFCLWHCTCTCTSESFYGFSCAPMTPEHYHEAGFRGTVPIINTRPSEFLRISIDILLVILAIFIIFFILGLMKWLFGMLYPPIARWGLDSLLSGYKIEEYIEPELKCRCVVTDDEKIPIHPDTGRRTVRICSKAQEFFFNTLFFFAYPSAAICHCIRKCREDRCRCDDSKNNSIHKETPRVITVKSYGDSKNSKLEQEDTEYVIKELNKSQLSLQDFSQKSEKKTT